ncbi:helix-turn-helix transcriptional regulator [Solibacillus sp. FSL H8-0538]|uniref:helix-turn-helix domain-containing protein n=1 Tax=Solibacillus sp. FSL H8-0538 TaxID=2921400 RepID=UPI0030FB688A
MNLVNVKLGALLKACRQKKGLSQFEMGVDMNYSQSSISKFENDEKVPDAYTLMQWGQITNCPEVIVAFLYGMDGITIIQQLLPIIGGIAIWFI